LKEERAPMQFPKPERRSRRAVWFCVAAAIGVAHAGCFPSFATDGAGASSSTSSGFQTCQMASDCPGEDTPCRKLACIGGLCSFEDIGFGTPIVPDPTPGDCQISACDGAGNPSLVDGDDPPIDPNPCIEDACDKGKVVISFAPSTKQCGATAAQHCDGSGICTGCVSGADCPPATECGTWSCDGMQNCVQLASNDGMPCGLGPSCMAATLKQQDTCSGGGCVPGQSMPCGAYACAADGMSCLASCNTIADCAAGYHCQGGSCATVGTNGAPCVSDADCSSSHCASGICCNEACTDPCETCSASAGSATNGICGPKANGASCGSTCATFNSMTPLVCQMGSCVSSQTQSCSPYLCNMTTCGTSCNAPTDCQTPYDCVAASCCIRCKQFITGSFNYGDVCYPSSASTLNALRSCAISMCVNSCASTLGNQPPKAPDPTCKTCVTTNCGSQLASCNADSN
jgi:hypothetical protein